MGDDVGGGGGGGNYSSTTESTVRFPSIMLVEMEDERGEGG